MPTLKQFEKATGIKGKRWKEVFSEVKQVQADEEAATEQLVEQTEKLVKQAAKIVVLQEEVLEAAKMPPAEVAVPKVAPGGLVSVRTIEDETDCKIEFLLGGEREADGKNYLEKKLGITYLEDADGARTQVSQADAVTLRDYGFWRAAEDRMYYALGRREKGKYIRWKASNDRSTIEDELFNLREQKEKYAQNAEDVEYYDRNISTYEERLAIVKAGNATPKPERFLTDYDRRVRA